MRKTLEEKLVPPVPPAVRRAMLDAREALPPGGADVTARLFAAMKENRDAPTLPSSKSFRDAAASESTFRTLLRCLARYAPHICTSNAVTVSEEWYARRPKHVTMGKSTPVQPTIWPAAWRALAPALDAAPIKQSSKRRYRASIDRCAAMVRAGRASSDFGFVAAADLADAFLFNADATARVKPITAAGYLDGLIALGRFGGIDRVHLLPMQLVAEDLREQAAMMPKNKEARIGAFMERGGFGYAADRIAVCLRRAESLPVHSAAGRRALQTAMVCAVFMNKPARKGDMVSWRIGHDIVRQPNGEWSLAWQQGKTGKNTEAGVLWPEVCYILDLWILGGRPDRLVYHRYHELEGLFLLSQSECQAYRNLPSELTLSAIGVPSHDLRTAAADYMRHYDPEHAANVISAHLGHGSQKSGEAYRSECSAAAGQSEWQRSRMIWS
ncbi:hypothetical protein ACN2XU_22850 [Primorskyibacter sp. 2E107]|uniref:hypothetical protein n=1 Tax=Primorskyibacter sp. 2E107 TaxID=3403458 RepID=UPI003AF58842